MIQIHDFPETMGGSHGFQDTLRLTPEAWLRIAGNSGTELWGPEIWSLRKDRLLKDEDVISHCL
jgi:hypothetical protein